MTTRFKNVSPLGALEVPALGRVVEAGEEFDVRDEVAELLIGQTENFAPAAAPAGPTIKELRVVAEGKGIEIPKRANRAEIIAALAEADAKESAETSDTTDGSTQE